MATRQEQLAMLTRVIYAGKACKKNSEGKTAMRLYNSSCSLRLSDGRNYDYVSIEEACVSDPLKYCNSYIGNVCYFGENTEYSSYKEMTIWQLAKFYVNKDGVMDFGEFTTIEQLVEYMYRNPLKPSYWSSEQDSIDNQNLIAFGKIINIKEPSLFDRVPEITRNTSCVEWILDIGYCMKYIPFEYWHLTAGEIIDIFIKDSGVVDFGNFRSGCRMICEIFSFIVRHPNVSNYWEYMEERKNISTEQSIAKCAKFQALLKDTLKQERLKFQMEIAGLTQRLESSEMEHREQLEQRSIELEANHKKQLEDQRSEFEIKKREEMLQQRHASSSHSEITADSTSISRDDHREELKQLRAELNTTRIEELQQLSTYHQEELKQLRAEHRDELKQLRAEHRDELMQMMRQQSQLPAQPSAQHPRSQLQASARPYYASSHQSKWSSQPRNNASNSQETTVATLFGQM